MKYLKLLGFLWPKKLFTRILLLVSTIMVISYLAAIILVTSFVKKVITDDILNYITRELNGLRLALDRLPEYEKISYLKSLRQANHIYLQADSRLQRPPGLFINLPIIQNLAQRLSDKLGRTPDLRVQPGIDRTIIWVRLSNVYPNYWYGLWLNKNKKQFSPWFIAQILLMLILSVLVVAWISVRLNRPFKRLTQLATHISQGQQPYPVKVSGAKEVKQLCVAFNTMSHAINRFESERALMLAGISHDLRTPLSRLRLALEMINDKQGIELKSGMVADLDEIDAVIGQFLTYIDRNVDEQIEKIEVNEFVSKIARRYNGQQQVIELHTISPTWLFVKPISLQRILTNLLDNALRYAGPPVTITLDKSDSQFQICIIDTGMGIPTDELDYLCQAFTRKNNSRSNANGAGLGLAIVQRIAKANSIEISFNNRSQGGLCVCLKLNIN